MLLLYWTSKFYHFLIYSSYSISILITSNFWLMPAGRHASRPACGQIGRLAGVPAGRQASVYATIRINRKIYPINMPKGDSSSVSILLLGSLSIGKRYSESGITAIFPIRRTRILVSTKTQQGVRLCQNADTAFFYAQSPDFLKPGLCYYPKFSYL